MPRRKTYKHTQTRTTSRGAKHTHFAGAPVAKRKYVKSGKYKGLHRLRGFGHLRNIYNAKL